MDGIYSVQAVMSLVDNITGPLKKVKNELGETGQAAMGLSGRMAKLAEKMLPVAIVAGGLLAAFTPCVSAAADLESGISAVGAVSNASEADMAALKQAALDLGASSVFSAREVAAAEEALAMAGFSVKENIAALPGVLDLASAAKMDLGRTADIASGALRAFGLDASKSGEVGDILATTFTSSKTTLESLSSVLSNAAPVAAAAGASLSDVAAMAGKLGDKMIDSSVAGTGIKTMFLRLQAPSAQTAKALNQLGVVTKDAAGNMLPIFDILQSIESKTKAMGSLDRNAILKDIFEAEGITSASALLETGIANVRAYAQTLNQQGKAAAVAKAKLDNFNGAVEMLSGAWDGLKITIGDVFLPILKVVVQWIAKVVDVLNTLASTSVGKILIMIAGVAATAGAAFVAFHAVSALFAAALPWITTAITAMKAALLGLSWPVWVLIAAVAVLSLAWRNNFGGMADKISAWWTKVTLVFRGVVAVFATLKNGVGSIHGQLAKDIKANGLVGIVTTVGKVIFRIKEAFSGFVNEFQAITGGLVGILLPIWNEITAALEPVILLVKEVVSSITGSMEGSKVSGWKLFGQIVADVVGFSLWLFVKVLKVLSPLLVVACLFVGALADALKLLGKAIGEYVGWALTELLDMPGRIGKEMGMVASMAGDLFKSLGKSVGGFFERAYMKAAEMPGRIHKYFMELAIVQWIKSAIETGGSLMDAGKNLLTTFIDGAWLTLTTSVETIKTTIMDLFSGLNLFESGAKLISTFTEGIRSAIAAPAQLVESGLQQIRNMLPFSDAKEGPLSTLTLSGARMMETLGEGVKQAAPALQSAVESALKIPEPGANIPGQAASGKQGQEKAMASETKAQSSPKKIEVHIRSLVLPDVKDSDGFIKGLKGLVEAHGW